MPSILDYVIYIYICIGILYTWLYMSYVRTYIYIYIHTLDMTMYVCTSLMIPSPRCSMSLSPIETLTEYAGSVSSWSSWGPKFLIEGKLLLDNNWVWVNMFTQRKWLICKRSQNLDLLCWLKMLPHFWPPKPNSTRCYSRMLSTFELVRPYLGLLNMYVLMYVYINIIIYNSCYICTTNG